jgi:preprotein translocase subunit SecE
MSKENAVAAPSLWQELFHAALYKPTQGRIARQATAIACALMCIIGAWRLYESGALRRTVQLQYGIPVAIVVIGCWLSYRIVNWPAFADFLIGVEAEMNKVSWPSWGELKRSSFVVITLIFGLTMLLFAYDSILWLLFTYVLGL